MRVIVTGAGGLLGKKIVSLVSKDHEVIGVYHTSKPATDPYLLLDLSKLENVKEIAKEKPDVIIHAAALTDVDKCEENPELAKLLNYEVTKEIAKIPAYIVYISTDYIFDGEKGNYREDDKPNPINVYGLTKLMGEEAVKKAEKYLIVRTSTPYGSNPASGKDNFALWLLKKLKNKERVKIVKDQITSPTLNTSFTLMLKEAIERRLTGVIHLADASQISRYEFSIALARVFNLNESLITSISMNELKWKAKRPKNSSLNVKKAMKLLNNKPLTVYEALRRLKEEMNEYFQP